MIKFSKFSIEELKLHKKISSQIQQFYKEESFDMYGIMAEDGIPVVLCKGGHRVLYISGIERIDICEVEIDDDYNIDLFATEDAEYLLTDTHISAIRKNGMEESLILQSDFDDDNPYAGHVVYTQYNREKDVEADIKYRHGVNINHEGRGRIYDYNLKQMDVLMIDKKSRKKRFDWGLTGRNHLYFGKLEFYCEDPDYDLLAIKEFGLGRFLHEGSYSLLRDRYVNVFSRGIFVGRDGNFKCRWPFGYPYKQEDLDNYLRKYGFLTEIPKDLLDVYNNDYPMYKKVSRILKELQKLEQEQKEDVASLAKTFPK